MAGHQAQAHVVSYRQLGVSHQTRVRLYVVDGSRMVWPLQGYVRARGVDDLRACCGVLHGDGRRSAVVLLLGSEWG